MEPSIKAFDSGWRVIAGRRIYFRSRWEANWGRYLEWLKSRGDIAEWEHEPETFWFLKIKRGVRSFLIDFRVTERSGAVVYHEVKGWMDPRSKTKLKRMAKYYPDVRVIVIDKRTMADLAAKLGRVIPGWETKKDPREVSGGQVVNVRLSGSRNAPPVPRGKALGGGRLRGSSWRSYSGVKR